ncbi:MAG: hybrid sensor histidine kinase/response regulator [Anaerolineae bacterium]|nr:hybrid sensor histidine kinase/response regulator [Anaerolineae bacterium]
MQNDYEKADEFTVQLPSEDISDMIAELQQATVLLSIPSLAFLGLFLLGSLVYQPANSTWSILTGSGLLLISVAVWALRKYNYIIAASLAVVSLLAAILISVSVGDIGSTVWLLIFPVGFSALMLSIPVGAGTALLCTLLLYVPGIRVHIEPLHRILAILGIWGTVWMIWLTLRPLLTTMQWAWNTYEKNRDLLTQSRNYQLQLQQTLEDLKEANIQLTRINQNVQGLRIAAEDARRAKEEFVANVSHELRTPLNMIIGFTDMIIEAPYTFGKYIPPALLADLTVIHRNSQHLSNLVDDVLDLSQIEVGQMSLTREYCALPEIIEAAVIAVQPLFESKALYLTQFLTDDLPLIFCDRLRIREVILNLLSNAGRFTETGGVEIHAYVEDKEVTVSVHDTGLGIADDDKGKVFSPFQQLDSSIRRQYGGTGLGLNISKAFVELHEGRMWFDSQLGQGTTFFFTLPVNPPATQTSLPTCWINPEWEYHQRTRQSLAPKPVVLPRYVILDQEEVIVRLLTRYLGEVEVVPTSSIDEAVEELAKVPSQALIVNATVVGRMLDQLSTYGALPYNTPAIICSVPGMLKTIDSLGVSNYLVKPIARNNLLATIEKLCPEAKSVLIIDDEPDARRLFWRMLNSSGYGYRVLTAGDGQQGLEIIRDEHPDIVLLDLIMPVMDGFQVLEQLAKDPDLLDIPVITISARDPAGQLIVSHVLAATQGGGISIPQLLTSINLLSQTLSPAGLPDDREAPVILPE